MSKTRKKIKNFSLFFTSVLSTQSSSLSFILAIFLSIVVFQVCGAAAVSTFSVIAEAIPTGVVLRFKIPEDLQRKTDHFLIIRSSLPAMLPEIATGTYTQLASYHEWYKDYFLRSEVGQTFFYHIQAWDTAGVIGYCWPLWTSWRVKSHLPTGVMLTPSAYRRIPLYDSEASGMGHILPINWDVSLSYYIGRLYGYNRLEELTTTRRNLFSRVGISFLQTDVKFVLERERQYFPQLSLGLEGAAMLRDAKAPDVANPTAEFKVKKENQRLFSGLFIVASKEIGWLRPSVGWVKGDSPSRLIYLTEFLPKASESDSGIFFNVTAATNKWLSLQWELIQPLRSRGSPWMINAQLGRALHTNFDLAYLHYTQGYEILAHLNFRLTVYPGSGAKK